MEYPPNEAQTNCPVTAEGFDMDYLHLNLTTTHLHSYYHYLHFVDRDITWPQVSWQAQAEALGFESRAVDSGAHTGNHLAHSSGFVVHPPAPLHSSHSPPTSCVVSSLGGDLGEVEAPAITARETSASHKEELPAGLLG